MGKILDVRAGCNLCRTLVGVLNVPNGNRNGSVRRWDVYRISVII